MKKVIIIGALLVLSLFLMGCAEPDANYDTLTVGTSSILYECVERGITMPCEKLSKYISPVGKCWNSELGNKICKTGWQEVKELPKCVFYGPRSKYLCDEEKCVLQVGHYD